MNVNVKIYLYKELWLRAHVDLNTYFSILLKVVCDVRTADYLKKICLLHFYTSAFFTAMHSGDDEDDEGLHLRVKHKESRLKSYDAWQSHILY